MVNYVRLQKTVERLISKNGRLVTFRKLDRTPDATLKPWDGPSKSQRYVDSIQLRAVFAPPNTVRQFGLSALGEGAQIEDLFKFVEKIGIVYQENYDLTQYDVVTDQGTNWNLVGHQLLQPAEIKLVTFVGLRR